MAFGWSTEISAFVHADFSICTAEFPVISLAGFSIIPPVDLCLVLFDRPSLSYVIIFRSYFFCPVFIFFAHLYPALLGFPVLPL